MICGPRATSSPGCPGGTGLPSSSTQRTSVEGTGMPMVPSLIVPPSGLKVSTGEDSVSP
jgi:hypothetical protein